MIQLPPHHPPPAHPAWSPWPLTACPHPVAGSLVLGSPAWPRWVLAALPCPSNRLFVSFSCQLSSPPASRAQRGLGCLHPTGTPGSFTPSLTAPTPSNAETLSKDFVFFFFPFPAPEPPPALPPRVFFHTGSFCNSTHGKSRRNKMCFPESLPAAGCQLRGFLRKGLHPDGSTLIALLDLPPPTDLVPLQPIYILGLSGILW